MVGKEIQRRDLLERIGSIKRQSQWLRAAEILGFRITHGGKHPYVVRDPDNLNNGDYKCSVTTIPSNLHATINQKIFKQILNSPISKRMQITEDDIWKALNF
jgi:hypothetical protein